MSGVRVAIRGTPRQTIRVFIIGILCTLAAAGCAHRTGSTATPAEAAKTSAAEADPYANLSPEERVTLYQDSLLVTPDDAVLHFRLGNAYFDLNQLSRAVEEYQAATRLDSTMANAWGNLGTALQEQDDLTAALDAYEKAVKLTPRDAAAWSNLGSVQYAKGQHQQAVESYTTALHLDAKNVQALYNLGVAFADARIYREALRYWQQVLEIDPRSDAGKNAQTNISLLQSLRTQESNKKQPNSAPRAARRPRLRVRPRRRRRVATVTTIRTRRRVLAAMSGGVDSAAAAALLVAAGHDVVGVTFRTRCYSEAGEDERKSVPCCSLDSIDDARRVCDRLGIRHHVLDVADEFERAVVDPFCDDYLLRGWTPNPCVACNGHIKFGRLLSLAHAMGCDRLATGHYARVAQESEGDQEVTAGTAMAGADRALRATARVRLMRGRDRDRDQSYVLWPLPVDTLARVLFPLGELTKEETRDVAREHGLAVADKEASQEICFVAKDYRAFVMKRAAGRGIPGLEPGPVVDRDGRIVGRHEGFAHFTVGQRKGLPAVGKPQYVTALDPATRTVRLGDDDELHRRAMRVERVNWIDGEGALPVFDADVQIRSRHRAAPARVERVEGDALEITFHEPQRAPTPGQSAVVYRGDDVVCGGIVTRVA